MNQMEQTQSMVDYIEQHLYEKQLNLSYLADTFGYSRYHLHRMFTGVTQLPIHTYIKRRRLSEAARKLVQSDDSILDIALEIGYETQRSFSKSFKAFYKTSPKAYRKLSNYLPLQLPYQVEPMELSQIQKPIEIKNEKYDDILLVGYEVSTSKGFFVIGKCWRNLHKHKVAISNRSDMDNLIAVNDYSNFEDHEEHPCFTYFAGAEVTTVESLPKGMVTKRLPASEYVVFTFQGKNQDSIQPMINYIYHDWFCESTCEFNENNPYDFVKYGEAMNENGYSIIEVWIPIQS